MKSTTIYLGIIGLVTVGMAAFSYHQADSRGSARSGFLDKALNVTVSEPQRYRIDVVLDTPDGEVEASMVYGIRSTCQDNPLGKRMCSTGVRAEAIPIVAGDRTFFLLTGTPEDDQQLLLGWKDSFENPGEFPLRFKPKAFPELVEFEDPADFRTVQGYGRYTPMPEGYEILSVVRTRTDEPITNVLEEYLPWADGSVKHEDMPGSTLSGVGYIGGYEAPGIPMETMTRMRFSDFKRKDF